MRINLTQILQFPKSFRQRTFHLIRIPSIQEGLTQKVFLRVAQLGAGATVRQARWLSGAFEANEQQSEIQGMVLAS